MESQTEWLWYDGSLVPSANATTHVLTHSLHYGVGVFEGIRAYQGDLEGALVFRLGDHVQRLFDSAKLFRMEIPYSPEHLVHAHCNVLRKTGLARAYIRPIAFYGPEKRGLLPTGAKVHVAIAAYTWDAYLGETASAKGIRMKTATHSRPASSSMLNRAKVSGAYTVSILAKMEATDDGCDEALLLDDRGQVAEASGENVLIVKKGHLIDPDSPCALLGITRDTVLALARDRGIPIISRPLTRDDIYLADEAFLTGTAAEVVPIVQLDRRTIGDGQPGPVTAELIRAYADVVRGRDPRHLEWVTRVAPASAKPS
jgi:branched-chain amino acid aminotransferase